MSDVCSSPEATTLYRKLRSFEIDPPGVEFTFAKRLALENGWSADYAERVIEEYRRFLVLATLARATVSPSDAVDQAWHLHMLYSRSYWNDLCDGILGRPLHHDPIDGGGRDRDTFVAQYTRAIADYREVFGEAPPSDIWPSPGARFSSPRRYARVPVGRFRRWGPGAGFSALFLGLLAVSPGWAFMLLIPLGIVALSRLSSSGAHRSRGGSDSGGEDSGDGGCGGCGGGCGGG